MVNISDDLCCSGIEPTNACIISIIKYRSRIPNSWSKKGVWPAYTELGTASEKALLEWNNVHMHRLSLACNKTLPSLAVGISLLQPLLGEATLKPHNSPSGCSIGDGIGEWLWLFCAGKEKRQEVAGTPGKEMRLVGGLSKLYTDLFDHAKFCMRCYRATGNHHLTSIILDQNPQNSSYQLE